MNVLLDVINKSFNNGSIGACKRRPEDIGHAHSLLLGEL